MMIKMKKSLRLKTNRLMPMNKRRSLVISRRRLIEESRNKRVAIFGLSLSGQFMKMIEKNEPSRSSYLIKCSQRQSISFISCLMTRFAKPELFGFLPY